MLDLVPLRLAAANGSVNGHTSGSLVAGGFTLLQRCAPLVRALANKRGAVILPPSAMAITALAACDGRGAVVMEPADALALGEEGLELTLRAARVGAIFTSIDVVRALAQRKSGDATAELDELELSALFTSGTEHPTAEPSDLIPVVLMDDVPASCDFAPVDAPRRRIDLGAHFGLDVAGTLDDPLREEEFVLFYRRSERVKISHRAFIERARELDGDRTSPRLIRELLIPLLSGAAIECVPRFTR